jgi:membrane peptidoglycan carboxypeptidase
VSSRRKDARRADTDAAHAAAPKRRWIDYPRRGKTGIRHWLPSWRQILAIVGLGIAVLAGAFYAAYTLIDIPQPNDLLRAQTSTIAYADGTPIAKLNEQNRTDVDLDKVPEATRDAVLAAENRSFYTDPGISVTGVIRAAWTNITSDSTAGGSTITQQYVKNMYLTQERSYSRKLKEVFISLKIDREMSKDEILQDYLNTIYFGRGAYGIQAAAQAYFGKDVGQLSVSESAVLAAFLRSPTLYAPEDHLEALKARWAYVLDGMVSQGWLSAADRAAQTFPAITSKSVQVRFPGQTGYLVAAAQRELEALGYSEDDIQRGGLTVTTTFEPKAQAAAEAAIASQLPPQEEWPTGFHAGLAAVRPDTGGVVAIYGGRGYQAGAYFDDAIQGASQSGSTFKPFALAAALENGFSLRDRFSGRNDREFPEYDGGRPVPNFGGESFGNIDLIRATANSVNTVYVDLTIQTGSDKVRAAAIKAGIPEDTQDLVAQPAVVLGVANVHPVDLADAYATFAAQGVHTDWHVITKITGPDGEVVYAANPEHQRVFAADVTADVCYAMQAVVEDGSGFAAKDLGRASAGKTGTTNDNKSSWYGGFVPQLSAAVGLWVEGTGASLAGFGGLDTVTGGSFPARTWTAFMQGALEGTPVQGFPEPAYVNSGPTSTFRPPPQSETPSLTPSDTPSATPTETESSTPTETPTETESPTSTPTIPPTGSESPPGRRLGDDRMSSWLLWAWRP